MLGCIPAGLGESKADKKAEYKFVIVPKFVHPGFDCVRTWKASFNRKAASQARTDPSSRSRSRSRKPRIPHRTQIVLHDVLYLVLADRRTAR